MAKKKVTKVQVPEAERDELYNAQQAEVNRKSRLKRIVDGEK